MLCNPSHSNVAEEKLEFHIGAKYLIFLIFKKTGTSHFFVAFAVQKHLLHPETKIPHMIIIDSYTILEQGVSQ